MIENLNSLVISAVRKVMPSSNASITYKGITVSEATCGAIRTVLRETDEGQMREVQETTIWFDKEHDPEAWGGDDIKGKVVTVSVPNRKDQEYRVIERIPNQGGIGLTIESKYTTGR